MEAYDIKDYIIRQFRPSCMVLTSALANQMCKENNLSPAEFLRPFADLRREQLCISLPERQPYFLKDFVMDLYDSADYDKTPASTHLKVRRVVLEANPPYFNFQEQPATDIKDLQSRRTPWYELWCNTFLELNRCQIGEMIHQPFGIFALISSEENVIETLQNLM